MLHKIKKVSQITLEVMKTQPHTRNSDRLLWLEVSKAMNQCEDVEHMTFAEIVKSQSIPNYETVSRCARKIRRKYDELRGTEAIQKERENNEAIYNFMFKKKITE